MSNETHCARHHPRFFQQIKRSHLHLSIFMFKDHQHIVIAVSICTNNSFYMSILLDQEIHRLKMGMETLLVANEDKVRHHCDTLSFPYRHH